MMCGRTAEALIIAAHGGEDLFNNTREMVLSSSKDRYLRNSFLPLLTGNVSELMEKIDAEKWKEALTILIINNSPASLVINLAEKLEMHSMFGPALACFVYAGSSERVFSSWINQFRHSVSNGIDYETATFELFFNAILYAESFRFFDSEILESIYFEYLTMLFRQGLTAEALEIMQHLKSPKHSMPLMVLVEKHIRANSGNAKVPWKVVNVPMMKAKTPVKPREIVQERSIGQTRTQHEPPRPVIPKEVAMPVPIKTAFQEPARGPFADQARGPFPEPVKSQDPPHEPRKVNILPPPPPPPPKPTAAEPKKSPFGEVKDLPPPDVKAPVPARPIEKAVNLPPPPPPIKPKEPVKHEQILPPPPPVHKPIEHIHPEPSREIVRPLENQIKSEPHFQADTFKPPPKPEEKKNVPQPVVPRPAPPAKFTPTMPARAAPRTQSTSDGVDLSGISQHLMPLANKWENAIKESSIASNPKILKDIEMKMQDFFNKLKNEGLDEKTLALVNDLTDAFIEGDYNTVNKAHLELTNKTWNENGSWLTSMKRIVQAKQNKR